MRRLRARASGFELGLTLPGGSALPEEPPTPLWQLVLEQFKDQLVMILLASAAVSLVLAFLEEGAGLTAFVDPAVVSDPFYILPADIWTKMLMFGEDPHYLDS